jgi:hypothetical protein
MKISKLIKNEIIENYSQNRQFFHYYIRQLKKNNKNLNTNTFINLVKFLDQVYLIFNNKNIKVNTITILLRIYNK